MRPSPLAAVLLALTGALTLASGCTDSGPPPPGPAAAVASGAGTARMMFHDLEAQTLEFMSYDTSIRLTPEQQKVKAAVLGTVPAPRCSSFTALTCCCSGNASRAIWGMTNYLIARRGYGDAELRETVDRWIAFSRPHGWSGSACSSGGCERSSVDDGCGGIDEHHLRL